MNIWKVPNSCCLMEENCQQEDNAIFKVNQNFLAFRNADSELSSLSSTCGRLTLSGESPLMTHSLYLCLVCDKESLHISPSLCECHPTIRWSCCSGSPSREDDLCARLYDGAWKAPQKRRPPSSPHLHRLCCPPRTHPDSLTCPRQVGCFDEHSDHVFARAVLLCALALLQQSL